MTKAILVSSKHKNKLYKDAFNGKVTFDYYKKNRNEYNQIVKIYKRHYSTNFVNRYKKNAKALWTMINSYIGKNFLYWKKFFFQIW